MPRSSIISGIKSSITSLITRKRHGTSSGQAAELAKELQKMQAFLPAPEVRMFDPNNVSIKFDFQN